MEAQTHYKKEDFFNCSHCGARTTESDYSISVALYGCIFLYGQEDGYFGVTCANPECKRTILKRFDIQSLNSLKSHLFVDPIQSLFDDPPRFKYRSFPYYTKPHNGPCEALAAIKRYGLENDIVRVSQDADLLENEPNQYSTISNGDFAVGPAITISWYDGRYLEQLCQIENESKIRIFPRYVINDPLIQNIDNFCWEHQLIIDFYIGENLPVPIYDIRQPASKRKIVKNFDFLNILDMRHNRDVSGTLPNEGMFLTIDQGPSSMIARPSDGAPHHIIDEGVSGKKIPPQEVMCDTLWENYEKSYIQELLDKMSMDFIDQYIRSNKETNFSYNDAWMLKQKYLKEIYDYIVSRKNRPVIKERLSKVTKKAMKIFDEQFPAFKSILSIDKEFLELKKQIGRLGTNSNHTFDILLLGESGTGKELFARAYHNQTRPDKPFIPVNCGSITINLFEFLFFGSEKGAYTDSKERHIGYFEEADGGTLFLDEIGELELKNQARFLRVLETKEIQPIGGDLKKVNVQIVSATNQDLYQKIKKNEFRSDLYHRINNFPFKIPPLQQRKNDIPILIDHFIQNFYGDSYDKESGKTYFTDECMASIYQYGWPGNVRELKNEIERLLATRPEDDIGPIDVSMLSDHIRKPMPQGKKTQKTRGRKINPGEDVLLSLKNEGLTHQEVADKVGAARETVTRWYSKIKNQ